MYQLTLTLADGRFITVAFNDREHMEATIKTLAETLETETIDQVVTELIKDQQQ